MVANASEGTVDVAVVGGGPAGAAAALTLLRHTDLRVAVVERGTGMEPRVGEAVSSGLLPLLRYLGVEAAFSAAVARVPSSGARASWGADRGAVREALFSPHGHGWHLDRGALDRMLLDQVAARGGRVWRRAWPARCERSMRGGWDLRLGGSGGDQRLRASVVVDASGRACALGRRLGARLRTADRLVGVVGCWVPDAPDAVREELSVETTELGWWYAAPVPGGRLVAALMTDAAMVRPLAAARPESWTRLLAGAALTSARLGPGHLEGPLLVRPARPQALEPAAGPGWIAAGDAALAHDPLSSLGIGHALASGAQAARVLWSDWPDRTRAREAYADDVRAGFARHLMVRRATYGRERRWPGSPFWSRAAGTC